MFVLIIATLMFSTDARSLFWGTRKSDPLPSLIMRGGSTITTTAVGVLDLRPDNSLSIFTNDGALRDAVIVSGSIGNFPVSTALPDDEEDPHHEKVMDLQSSVAETIGTLCGSVCLLIAYNPKAGKTVLHRTAGVKLAAMVNGMRQRQTKQKTTKLTLLLFCDNNDGAACGDGGSGGGTDTGTGSCEATEIWDPSGANFLVERLRAFFAMGSTEDTVPEDPLPMVEFLPIWMTQEVKTKVLDIMFARSMEETCDAHFASLVQSTYDSMGGIGQIVFDE